MSEQPSCLTESRRRNVIRMAGLYLVGGWMLVQVAEPCCPMFGAPDWRPRSIVIRVQELVAPKTEPKK